MASSRPRKAPPVPARESDVRWGAAPRPESGGATMANDLRPRPLGRHPDADADFLIPDGVDLCRFQVRIIQIEPVKDLIVVVARRGHGPICKLLGVGSFEEQNR